MKGGDKMLKRSKKGFTLIELMVVVAIIGVLALLGLRLYTVQMDKAKNALVKANVGTIQTLIQAELADETASTVWTDIDALFEASGIRNPIDGEEQETNPDSGDAAVAGEVWVTVDDDDIPEVFSINGINANDDDNVYDAPLTARK